MYAYFDRFELQMTKGQARAASHQGACDDDIAALAAQPGMARQLARLDPADVAAELREYGAWDSAELADHQANLLRLVWIAACNIWEEQCTPS